MARYELTEAADKDFENIFDFGISRFGLDRALKYQNGLKRRFDEIAKQPKLYSAVDHIRRGYRRSVYASHAIYFQIAPKHILIVRILGQQDLTVALQKGDS